MTVVHPKVKTGVKKSRMPGAAGRLEDARLRCCLSRLGPDLRGPVHVDLSRGWTCCPLTWEGEACAAMQRRQVLLGRLDGGLAGAKRSREKGTRRG